MLRAHRRGAARRRPRALQRAHRRPRPVHRAARCAATCRSAGAVASSTSSGGPKRSAPSSTRLTSGAARQAPDLPRALIDTLDPADAGRPPRRWSRTTWSRPGFELIGTRTLPRSPSACWRGRRRARDAAAARHGRADRKLRRREGPGARGGRQLERAHARPQASTSAARPRCLPAPARSAGQGRRRSRTAPSSPPSSAATSSTTRASCSRCRARAWPQEPRRRRRPLRHLLADVGAPAQVPAVGACIHTERLLAVLQGAAP